METDLRLFRELEQGNGPSTLRLYSWQPNCLSLGYAQKIEQEVNVAKAAALGWDVVKRPTGGGIVFHNEAEVTYSLVMALDDPLLPKGLVPSYKKISEAIVHALRFLGISAQISAARNPQPATRNPLCFSYPAEYELVVRGKKIVGSAQKQGRKALLQQGSIFVRRTSPDDLAVLKREYGDLNAISIAEVLGREPGHEEIAEALIKGFKECLRIQ